MNRTVLERAGFQVIAVADGSEAMARIGGRGEPIDVLVTDVVMPHMSGIELAERVIDLYPGVGIVLLSGYTAETLNLERITRRGATFVAKPVSPQCDQIRDVPGAHIRTDVASILGRLRRAPGPPGTVRPCSSALMSPRLGGSTGRSTGSRRSAAKPFRSLPRARADGRRPSTTRRQ